MSAAGISSWRGRKLLVLDAGLAVWVLLWAVMGVMVADRIGRLVELSDTMVTAGRAVRTTGEALHRLEDLPFVGREVGRVADRIDSAAHSAIASGVESRDGIQDLALLMGLSMAAIPTIPMIVLYVPYRVARARQGSERRPDGHPAP